MLRDPPGDGGAEGRHVGEHLVAKRRYHVGRGGPDLVLGARLVAGPPDPRRDHGGAVVRGELLVGRVQDRLPGPGWAVTPVLRLSGTMQGVAPPRKEKACTWHSSHVSCFMSSVGST